MTARLVFYGERSASLSLYLDGLPPELAVQVAVLPPRRMERDFVTLAAAGLVVFVRGFEAVWRSGLLAALTRIGVPCAWFTDDDLTMLRGEQPGFGFYDDARVRAFCARMVAVIGTAKPLCARLAAYHRNVLLWPCVLNERLLAVGGSETRGPYRIGFVGGGFRVEGLRRLVVPALATRPDAALYVVEGEAARIAGARVLPFEPDFDRFVAAWRAVAPDVLVHPPGQTRNIGNKAPGILLTALYLGAAPIVADEPAFDGLGAGEGVVRAGDAAAWRAALEIFAEPAARRENLNRLLAHARVAWAPELARGAVDALLREAAPGGAEALARRRAAMALGWSPSVSFMWRRRLGRIASRFR